MQATTARAMWEVLEPFRAVTYFAPEARAATEAAGLIGGWMGYFGSRAAPLGPAPAELVVAVFYNFHPSLVRRAIPDAWQRAAPQRILAARLAGVELALRRLLGGVAWSAELAEAAALAREAADGCDAAGRAMFAANAALPWPGVPHLDLWTAATRLREHRADGHLAALLAAGIGPCEAHLTLAGTGAIRATEQRRFRGFPEAEWEAAAARLRDRGWLQLDGTLTEEGRQVRGAVERTTDELGLDPWVRLGAVGSARLYGLMRDLSERIVVAGGVPAPNPMGLTWPPAASPPVAPAR